MKKNVRVIPEAARSRLKSLREQCIVAGCARQFSAESIRNGALAHLQIQLDADGLHVAGRVLPRAAQGKYSARNIAGYEVVRRDLPKETHYNVVDAPDWGDWSNGTHDVLLPYEKYPRDFYAPRELELCLYCADTSAARSSFVIAARVDEVFNQGAPDFETRLLENLNLLQENLGGCGVEAADFSIEDYGRTLQLSWEILPPGSLDEAIERLFRGRRPTQQERKAAEGRYEFFESLNPLKLIVGSCGFRRYFGALLEDNLVVFENVEYGNAVYLMYDNWEELSQLSRLELLSGRLGDEFDRVIHREGWQAEVRRLVEAKRHNNGNSQRLPRSRPQRKALKRTRVARSCLSV